MKPPVFAPETAVDPAQWRSGVPSTGHCAVAALLVNALAGGRILRVALADGGSHYYNELPDGTEVDLTRDQFDTYEPVSGPEERQREQLLGDRQTAHRFLLLCARLATLADSECWGRHG